ncbi:hypothetical protein EDC01DRAFT_637628 [Geopyxis carbonaria]|nr:hypothetical protein EDC01DRAFT_637628 [Geopyxis carbonaria]
MASSSPNCKRSAPPSQEKITTIVERSSKRARVDAPVRRLNRFKRKHQEQLDNKFRPQLQGLSTFLSSVPLPPGEEERWNSLRKAVADALELSSKSFLPSPDSMNSLPKLERKRAHSPIPQEEENQETRDTKKLKRSHKNGCAIPSAAGAKRSRGDEEVTKYNDDDNENSEDDDAVVGSTQPGRVDIGFKRPRTTYIQEGDPAIEYASTVEGSDSDSSDSDDNDDGENDDYAFESDDNDGDSDG